MPYSLTCSVCGFQEVVPALEDVHEQTAAHRSAFGDDHTVSFEVVDERPFLRGGVSDTWE